MPEARGGDGTPSWWRRLAAARCILLSACLCGACGVHDKSNPSDRGTTRNDVGGLGGALRKEPRRSFFSLKHALIFVPVASDDRRSDVHRAQTREALCARKGEDLASEDDDESSLKCVWRSGRSIARGSGA